jgi:hypothetical protein
MPRSPGKWLPQFAPVPPPGGWTPEAVFDAALGYANATAPALGLSVRAVARSAEVALYAVVPHSVFVAYSKERLSGIDRFSVMRAHEDGDPRYAQL